MIKKDRRRENLTIVLRQIVHRRPPLLRIEDAYGFDTLAVCHVLIHPIAPPSTVIALEACGSSHYWDRELTALGHTVRVIPPRSTSKPMSNAARTTATTPKRSVRPPASGHAFRAGEVRHATSSGHGFAALCSSRHR